MRRALVLFAALAACDKPAPPPAAPEPDPVVADTEPDPAAFELTADAPDGAADCEARVSYANSAVERAREAAALGCTNDEDCVLVSMDTGCQGGCQNAVAAEHQEAFVGLQSALDANVCKGYREKAKCPYATPRCVRGTAKCDYGTCEFEIDTASY